MIQEEAAAKEVDFFERDTFFSSAAVASVRKEQRFGVDALRMQLSKQLVSLTQRELPKMKEALDAVLAEVGDNTYCCATAAAIRLLSVLVNVMEKLP
jgi:hypothetical protein